MVLAQSSDDHGQVNNVGTFTLERAFDAPLFLPFTDNNSVLAQ